MQEASVMTPILGAVLLTLGFVLIYLFRSAGSKLKNGNYPKSLPSLPIIGSLLHLGSHSQPHLLFCDLQKKYGSLYSLKLGSCYVVIVNNHQHAKEVLMKKGKIFAGRPRMISRGPMSRMNTSASPGFLANSTLHAGTCRPMLIMGKVKLQVTACKALLAKKAGLTEVLAHAMGPLEIYAFHQTKFLLLQNNNYRQVQPYGSHDQQPEKETLKCPDYHLVALHSFSYYQTPEYVNL